MPSFLSEAELEESLLHQFRALGYACANGDEIGPDGKKSERESYEDVVLVQRLEDAVYRLNPGLPSETRQEVVRRVLQSPPSQAICRIA